MIRTIAIDDEPLALQQLANYIENTPFLQLVGKCQSAVEAKEIMEKEEVDAIFCDIIMPDINGMDFIKSLPVAPIVVFTTASSEYAIDGFKVDAADYLLKPFGMDEFRRAALRVKQRYEMAAIPKAKITDEDDTVFIKTDKKIMKIAFSDIRYIESMSEYQKFYIEGKKPITVLLALKKIEECMPAYFMRIHRSYIINLKKIQEVNKNRVIMDEETYLPIGDNYKDAFVEYVTTRFLGK